AADLLADHPARVGVAVRAAHAADGVEIEALDLPRAGAGAIVGAHGGNGLDPDLGHGPQHTPERQWSGGDPDATGSGRHRALEPPRALAPPTRCAGSRGPRLGAGGSEAA